MPAAVIIFLPSLHLYFLKAEKKNTLAFLSFENRATPKTIRAGSGGVCAKRILKELGPSGYTDSFPPLFWLPKTKEFQRKIRAGPHPEPPLPLPPPLSLSPPLLPFSFFMAKCTHTNTQHSKGDFTELTALSYTRHKKRDVTKRKKGGGVYLYLLPVLRANADFFFLGPVLFKKPGP